MDHHKILLPGTVSESPASKYIIQRLDWTGPPESRVQSWLAVGEADHNPDGDSYIVDEDAIPGEAYRYRFKAVLKARDGVWVYFTERIPPPVTPRGMCAPLSPTWYTYTVTHPVVDMTGYYKLLPEKVAYNSENSQVCFIYNPNLKIWLLVRIQAGVTVAEIQSTTTSDIKNAPGVYYYSVEDPGDWIPMHAQYWSSGENYKHYQPVRDNKPVISCYYPIPTPTPSAQPEIPPPHGPPHIPPTPTPTYGITPPPTPTPSPTAILSYRMRLLHESGLPLLAESGDYFSPEQ